MKTIKDLQPNEELYISKSIAKVANGHAEVFAVRSASGLSVRWERRYPNGKVRVIRQRMWDQI